MRTCGICCPGPSLSLRSTQQKINKDGCDYLVALNCAVFSSFKFDYWVMVDIEMFESCYCKSLYLQISLKDIVLWIPQRWLRDIPADYDPINNFFNQFKNETFSYGSKVPFSVPIPHIKFWWNYSLFVAIAEVIARGAKVINIYGADMCGSEYFKPGFRNGRTRHNDTRWAEETTIFNIIKYECNKHDICIVKR